MGEGEERTRSHMNRFSVELTSRARRSLKQVPQKELQKINGALEILRTNPHPPASKRLRGGNTFRVKIGNYRILYQVKNSVLIVLVIDIGHRREIYRRS